MRREAGKKSAEGIIGTLLQTARHMQGGEQVESKNFHPYFLGARRWCWTEKKCFHWTTPGSWPASAPNTVSSIWEDKRQNVLVFHSAAVFWLGVPTPAGRRRDQVLSTRDTAQAGSQCGNAADRMFAGMYGDDIRQQTATSGQSQHPAERLHRR